MRLRFLAAALTACALLAKPAVAATVYTYEFTVVLVSATVNAYGNIAVPASEGYWSGATVSPYTGARTSASYTPVNPTNQDFLTGDFSRFGAEPLYSQRVQVIADQDGMVQSSRCSFRSHCFVEMAAETGFSGYELTSGGEAFSLSYDMLAGGEFYYRSDNHGAFSDDNFPEIRLPNGYRHAGIIWLGNDIRLSLSPGTVTVEPVPLPASGAALLSALALLGLRRRKT